MSLVDKYGVGSDDDDEDVDVTEAQQGTLPMVTTTEDASGSRPTFDDVFKLIGNIGCGQIMVYVFIILIETHIGLCMLYVALEMANPGWYCPGLGRVSALNLTGNQSKPVVDDMVFTKCPANPEYRNCVNRTFTDKYDSIVNEWNLVCDLAYISSTIASLFFGAQLIGALIAGHVSDRFGRKIPLLVIWLGMMTCQSCLSFTPTWHVYAVVRFLVGMSIGALVSVTCVLPMEQLGSRWRTLVAYRIGWHISPMLLSLFAYLFRTNWRHLTLITGLFGLPIFPFVAFFMPESARWQVQKGRIEAAEATIRTIAKYNRRPAPRDLTFLKEVKKQDDLERNMVQNYNITDLFRTVKMAIRTAVLLLAWATAAFFSYVLNIKMSEFSGTSLYINLIISGCSQMVVRSSVIYLINKLGRKKSYLLYISLAGGCMATIMILDLAGVLRNYSYLVTAFALIGLATNAGTWSCNHVITVELYPTLMRGIAISAGNMAARIGAMLAPLVKKLDIIPYIILAVLAIVSGILVSTLLPETLGKPLPEAPPPGDRKCCRKRSKKKLATDVEIDKLHNNIENDKILKETEDNSV